MKKHCPNMRTDKNLPLSLPIWIRLPGISFKLQGADVINELDSSTGIPIKMDSPTASRSKIQFAGVLVELKVDSRFPKKMFEDGSIYKQKYKIPPTKMR